MVDKDAPPPIAVWEGCDPEVADAISTFSDEWGPYSTLSRRHSIYSLLRDRIDPSWSSLFERIQQRVPNVLAGAWMRYRLDHLMRTRLPVDTALNGTLPFSSLSKRLGFKELDFFIQFVGRAVQARLRAEERSALPSLPLLRELEAAAKSIDSLRELAVRCDGKKPRRSARGKLNALRGGPYCELCGEATELAAYIAGGGWPEEDADDRLRLSSTFCRLHRPKAAFSNVVQAEYLRARRGQAAFEQEVQRLDRQSYARRSEALARSGDSLVDEFIQLLCLQRDLSIYSAKQTEAALDVVQASLEARVRREARALVDAKVTDQKKRIVVLLCKGMNQSEAAAYLGLSRQAVSKAIEAIPSTCRLDIATRHGHRPAPSSA